MLRETFGSKGDSVSEEWCILHKEELREVGYTILL
jgi:hypothetical protein